jgi:chromosome segregation protein
LAADADSRKDALVEEVRASARAQKERLDRDREALSKEQESLEQMKKEAKDSGIEARAKLDELEYGRRELQAKVETLGRQMAERTRECEGYQRENETLRRQVRDCQGELSGIRESALQVEALLRKETDELRAEVEDLAELVKVKDRMLDDQNVALSQAKQAAKQKDEELLTVQEKQGRHHSKYEDRIAEAQEEAERQRSRCDEMAYRIKDLEDELDQLHADNTDLHDQLAARTQQLTEKEAIIDLVDQEVSKIKESQEADKHKAQERE